MKGFGLATAAAGVVLGLIALILKTDVGGTINIGLLQNQQLTFLGGCFLFLGGVVITCTAVVIEALGRVPAVTAKGTIEAAGGAAAASDPAAADPNATAGDGPKDVDDVVKFGAVLICIIVLAFVIIFLANH